MAVDLLSETSPRISFSYDLVSQTDIEHQNRSRLDSSLLIDSNFDFEFNIHQEYGSSSSADELFSNGLILPIQIQERKKSDTPQKFGSLPPRPEVSSTPSNSSKKESLKKTGVANFEQDEEKPHRINNKSFWGFRRSTSLNGGYENVSKMSLIFALPILSRSRSTGSASSSASMKHNSHKVPSIPMSISNNNNNNNANTTGLYACKTKQKVKKKKSASSYGQVLNVPPPYISKRAASLFGLSSFFSKDKKNKKLS